MRSATAHPAWHCVVRARVRTHTLVALRSRLAGARREQRVRQCDRLAARGLHARAARRIRGIALEPLPRRARPLDRSPHGHARRGARRRRDRTRACLGRGLWPLFILSAAGRTPARVRASRCVRAPRRRLPRLRAAADGPIRTGPAGPCGHVPLREGRAAGVERRERRGTAAPARRDPARGVRHEPAARGTGRPGLDRTVDRDGRPGTVG